MEWCQLRDSWRLIFEQYLHSRILHILGVVAGSAESSNKESRDTRQQLLLKRHNSFEKRLSRTELDSIDRGSPQYLSTEQVRDPLEGFPMIAQGGSRELFQADVIYRVIVRWRHLLECEVSNGCRTKVG